MSEWSVDTETMKHMELPAVKPIETQYKSYRFRSRLEARWAVFFDALGLEWDYEPEGFDLPSGYYLPDFLVWIPTYSPRYIGDGQFTWEWVTSRGRPGETHWVEIKGIPPTEKQCERLQQLAETTQIDAYLFFGDVHQVNERNRSCSDSDSRSGLWFAKEGFGDGGYLWCECPTCQHIGISQGGNGESIPCSCSEGRNWEDYYNNCTVTTENPHLLAAYRKARQARFDGDERYAY